MVAVKTPTLAEVYKTVCAALKADPKQTALVTAHIAAKHSVYTLPAFHNSDAISDEDKLATYGEIVRVLAGKAEASTLRGAVAHGQAETKVEPVEPPPPAPPAFDPADLTRRRDAVIPLPAGDRPPALPPPAVEPPPPPAAVDQLREALRQVLGPQEAKLDEKRVREIATEIAAVTTADSAAAVLKEAESAIADALAAVKPTVVTHEFKLGAEPPRPVSGVIHRQLPQIVAWMQAGVPVWLWGQAGGGKTHLARQVAEAMGLPFYCAPIDETITVGKLVGFRNVSNGEFVEGLMYRAYKHGGVQLLDEIDTNATAIASTNSLTANGHYTFPNGEEVARHDNWRLIAGANSRGTGAVAGYTARVRMDAATLDRFAVIKLDYDPGLELALACGVPSTSEPWKPAPVVTGDGGMEALCRAYVDWVQKVRIKVGDSVLISPRASYLGVRALRVGIPSTEVAEALVFKLVTEDTRRRILSEAGSVPTP